MAVALVLSAFCLVLVVVYVILSFLADRKYKDIPAMRPRLPVVGNAWSLDMCRPHVALAELSRKYGPVFRIRLYGEEIVVLNDYSAVSWALVAEGGAFAGRPVMYRTAQAQRSSHSIVWQSYTPKLQFLRKHVLRCLRMYGSGLERLQECCEPQMLQMLDDFRKTLGTPVNPREIIYDAVCNIMLSLLIGKTYPRSHPYLERLKAMTGMFNEAFGSGGSRIVDFLPWLRHFRDERFRDLHRALAFRDALCKDLLEEWKANRDHGDGQAKDCVVSSLFDVMNEDKARHHDVTEATVKEVFTNLVLAGTDTTATALCCLLLQLVHRPEIQERMRSEILYHVGCDRLPQLSDRPTLPFTEAVLLELLRHVSHVPLAVPHCTTCPSSVCGLAVPADCTVYVNLWAMHHDPVSWPEPFTFDPHRFLDPHGNLHPPTHENRRKLLPFGAGRRVCLGETLAKNRLFLFATVLLQHFRFRAAPGTSLPSADPRDMAMGLVLHPPPFSLVVDPAEYASQEE